MISGEELKKGNIVAFSSQFVEVEEVFERTILIKLPSGETIFLSFESIYPIPLTPKMLIDQLGYVKLYGKSSATYGRGFFILDQGDGSFLSIPQDDRFYFLHQLQNLYLKLTGDELPVNFCTIKINLV